MFHKFSLTFLLFASALVASAQSGRIKPPETPAPTPRPRLVYLPTQTNSQILIPIPAPTPPPKIETNDDDEVIRVDSALVPIPVSVTDATGRPVTNLNIEDFELTVDGKTAEISDLFRSDAPVRLALLFDNSTSVSEAREFEKNAAVRFFRRILRPKDLAALYSVSSGTRLEQPLTKNSDQLIRAIESFPPPQGATALLDGIIKAAGYLQEVEGRRVIVIVSDGDDTVSDSTFEETIRAVQKANCQIYIIKTTDFENYKRTGIRGGNANIRQLSAERRMQEIALQTGGAVYSPIDERELDAAFNQISAELSQQYVLNYYPEDAVKTNEFRTIALKIKKRDNLTVRTRKGYYVSKR